MTKLREMFLDMDKDQDGSLSYDEIESCIKNQVSDEQIKELM